MKAMKNTLSLWRGLGFALLFPLMVSLANPAQAARFYDPVVGRFLQRDTIKDGPSPFFFDTLFFASGRAYPFKDHGDFNAPEITKSRSNPAIIVTDLGWELLEPGNRGNDRIVQNG